MTIMDRFAGFAFPNTKPATGNSMKGQAAIEYLMTYGWAILVIAIVIVALTLMTQSGLKVEQCSLPVGYVCNDPLPQIISSGGRDYLAFTLQNKGQQTMKIRNIICTVDSPQDAKISDSTEYADGLVTIQPGASFTFNGDNKVKCMDKGSNNPLRLLSGQDFRGYIVIWYNYDNDPEPDIKRLISGTVSGQVLQG